MMRGDGGQTNDLLALIGNALLEALAHAERHGDTRFVLKVFDLMPSEQRAEYAGMVGMFAPLLVSAKKGSIFVRIRSEEHDKYHRFDLRAMLRALNKTLAVKIDPPQGSASQALVALQKHLIEIGRLKALPDAGIKKLALKAMEHVKAHRDVTVVARLVEKLPEKYWENGFRVWLYGCSPIRRDPTSGKFNELKPDAEGYCDYDFKLAASTPILVTGWPRDILLDHAFAAWKSQLHEMAHLELLDAFQRYTSAGYRSNHRNREAFSRVFESIEAEWCRRSECQDWFKWPAIHPGRGSSALSSMDAPEPGMFAALGYHVGKVKGQREDLRRFLLDRIFSRHLPPLHGPEYMSKWANPGEAARLKQMAYFLAHTIENASRRKDTSLATAISEWNSDLDYLYVKYYVGHFRFAWPSQ